MRASVPLASVMIQTLSAPVTIDPSDSPIPIFIVAAIAAVFRSTREIVLSPQLGTHRLPKSATRPEHGSLPTVIVVTALDFGSSRDTVFFGSLETHAVALTGSMASQSGLPGTSYMASGLRRSIGILTPGALTPGFGGRAAVCRNAARASSTNATSLLMSAA